MLTHKRLATALGLIVVASMVLVACTPQATAVVPTAQVIIQTQIVEVEGTPVVQEVVITATPAPVVKPRRGSGGRARTGPRPTPGPSAGPRPCRSPARCR